MLHFNLSFTMYSNRAQFWLIGITLTWFGLSSLSLDAQAQVETQTTAQTGSQSTTSQVEAPALEPLQNQLANNPSPYLALHGNDPTAWQLWGADVLKRAKQENKLIFLSSGYFSCHWCHVMQRESYQNEEIAKILNSHFIPVKIDRELEPALDGRLMDYAHRNNLVGHLFHVW